jgi:AcrR family transcriptional regulator
MHEELTGTKELIFDTFIEMTSSMGYENVTIREIARKVGINAASIYYHYESKEKILEHVYEYYNCFFFDGRRPLDKMKEMVETANPEEFIIAMTRNYVSEDSKREVRMILITKIIYMRLFQDINANTIFSNHNKDDTNYIIEVMQHAISIGRVQPDFDVEIFASVMIGTMLAMGLVAFADPNYTVGLLEHETRVRLMLGRIFESALL